MSTVIETDDIDETAARWVMRMDRGELGEAEQRELDVWLEADSRHRGAFVRAQAIWCDLDRVAALSAGTVTAQPQLSHGTAAGQRAAAVAALRALH